MKGRKRMNRESRAIVRKAWRDRGIEDLRLLSAVASLLLRGGSDKEIVDAQALLSEVRCRWCITAEDEIGALDRARE